jgi:hypothetical protein
MITLDLILHTIVGHNLFVDLKRISPFPLNLFDCLHMSYILVYA